MYDFEQEDPFTVQYCFIKDGEEGTLYLCEFDERALSAKQRQEIIYIVSTLRRFSCPFFRRIVSSNVLTGDQELVILMMNGRLKVLEEFNWKNKDTRFEQKGIRVVLGKKYLQISQYVTDKYSVL